MLSLDDVFQVRMQGQLVPCIRAEALEREIIKNAYSIFYCNYERVKNIISLKKAVGSTDTSALWLAAADGMYLDSSTSNYISYKKNDILLTEELTTGTYHTLNLGNVFSSTEETSAKIYTSMSEVYSKSGLKKGTLVICLENGVYNVYAKKTEGTGTTTSADWVAVGTSQASITNYSDLAGAPKIYFAYRAKDETDSAAITRVTTGFTLNNQDIVIIQTHLSYNSNNSADTTSDVVDVTTYCRDDGSWKRQSGKVDAKNIIFGSDIESSGDWDRIGGISRNEGYTFAGKSLQDVLESLFDQTVTPTVKTEPVITITANRTGSNEVGTQITSLNYTISLTDGLYTCAGVDQQMNARITEYTVVYGSTNHYGKAVSGDFKTITTANIAGTGSIPNVGTATTFMIPANYSKNFTVYAKVEATRFATDNKGNTTTVKYNPTIRNYTASFAPSSIETDLPANISVNYTHSASSATLSSYRVGCFYGNNNTAAAYESSSLTSAIIRALNKTTYEYPSSGSKTVSFNTANGTKQLLVAVPHGKVPTVYNDTVKSPIDMELLRTLDVFAADLSDANKSSYDIYVYTPAIAFRTANTITVTMSA